MRSGKTGNHRTAGPRKGSGSGVVVNVRKPPKEKKAAPVSKRHKHEGAFATIGDSIK